MSGGGMCQPFDTPGGTRLHSQPAEGAGVPRGHIARRAAS